MYPKNIINFRKYNNSLLPKWYTAKLHLFFNGLIFILFLSAILYRLNSVNLFSIIIFIFGLFSWSIIEYLIHRFVLHGNFLNKLQFKKEHSIFHHSYFTHNDNIAETLFDINRILLRPIDIMAVLILMGFISFSFTIFFEEQIALLIFLSGISYIIIYETFHGICHCKRKFKSKILNIIINHHKHHHNKKIMESKNFAVVFPVIDKLFRSYYA